MAKEETKRSLGWVWIAVGLAVCVGAYFFMAGSRAKVVVRDAKVERHDLSTTVSTNGQVEPPSDFQPHAAMPGIVQKVYVSLAEKVSAGQPLVKMDDSDARKNVAAAEAQLDGAVATLKNMEQNGTQDERLGAKADMQSAVAQEQAAETSLSSLLALQAQGAASANEVASAKQRQSDAQMKITQLKARASGRYGAVDIGAQRAQVAQAQAALDAAKVAYTGVDVRAPFAGTIYALRVAPYDSVPAGEVLLGLADLNHLQVRAYFDEPEIGKLAVGQPVTIVWDAKPTKEWHGHILQAPTTVTIYGSRNVGECLITVDDAHGDLLPNTNVTVKVTTQQTFNVVSLPREALHVDAAGNYVYRIVDGHLVKANVQIGALNQTRFQILSGLKEGDLVALGATTEAELSDGLQVKVQQ